MELVRKILLAIESHEAGFFRNELEIEGYTEEKVGYHVYLMMEAGLVNGVDETVMTSTSPSAIATGLTWEGHEFIDAARNETIWKTAMQKVQSIGGSVTIAVLTALLRKLVGEQLGV